MCSSGTTFAQFKHNFLLSFPAICNTIPYIYYFCVALWEKGKEKWRKSDSKKLSHVLRNRIAFSQASVLIRSDQFYVYKNFERICTSYVYRIISHHYAWLIFVFCSIIFCLVVLSIKHKKLFSDIFCVMLFSKIK